MSQTRMSSWKVPGPTPGRDSCLNDERKRWLSRSLSDSGMMGRVHSFCRSVCNTLWMKVVFLIEISFLWNTIEYIL